jgi:hypothetical protein
MHRVTYFHDVVVDNVPDGQTLLDVSESDSKSGGRKVVLIRVRPGAPFDFPLIYRGFLNQMPRR